MSTGTSTKRSAAIIGSGNIGTDLLIKLLRTSTTLTPTILVGVDPASDGLARAERLGVATTSRGIAGLIAHPLFADVAVVFDATSARAHVEHAAILKAHGKRVVDLTPAAVGPYVVPAVNLDVVVAAAEANLNMVTCGGQATIPMVFAIKRAAGRVRWAEIVASIASKSAGPGTRANIDEFTQTTARAIEQVGGAERGTAIIVLNPAEPPVIMRDTVIAVVDGGPDVVDVAAIEASIRAMVDDVARYVPGYRLVKPPVFDAVTFAPPDAKEPVAATKITVFLEVEGAGHYLPNYAGNLDIMTSAALRVGEALAAR
ncbi:MAG TPA: acetaldehyde dehydrogenase (acetylating) [Myxococcota bacterium]